jgi:hypothetical protein
MMLTSIGLVAGLVAALVATRLNFVARHSSGKVNFEPKRILANNEEPPQPLVPIFSKANAMTITGQGEPYQVLEASKSKSKQRVKACQL